MIKSLANRKKGGSISGQILNHFGLEKADIRELLRKLANNRPLQVTLCNLIGAGRFKTVHENNLMRTICPKCKKPDSWTHHKLCYQEELPRRGIKLKKGAEVWMGEMIKYLKIIKTENPAKHDPSKAKY